MIAGLRQAELARKVGISASYLNLIEHNRRRIGGKLLIDIASTLGVEPSMLTEGAGAALIATLREAAADAEAIAAETDRVDEFAGRFPGWAEVLAREHARVSALERTVVTLSDRLTHDPHLAASLHEVLSTAAAIRSTAAILAEDSELDREWRDRFHRNLNQDAERLAESSKALVNYLDESDTREDHRGVPMDEIEALLAGRNFHFPELEEGGEVEDGLLKGLGTQSAREIGRSLLKLYAADARKMPLERTVAALGRTGLDPLALARRFGVELPVVFRRLAALPEGALAQEVGLVVCDASGSTLFRKPVSGFAMPRYGESCPLWPVFSALSRPMSPIRRRVVQQGRAVTEFDCYAVAWPSETPGFDLDPVYHSIMLILPVPAEDTGKIAAQPVGSSCRVCSRQDCPARREPSILSQGF